MNMERRSKEPRAGNECLMSAQKESEEKITKGRELSPQEKRRINRSVRDQCSLYDKEYGCLYLDTACYMSRIGFTSSSLCRYYEEAILPMEAELVRIFKRRDLKKCRYCGRTFPINRHQLYCSDRCSDLARKKKTAERVRRYRERNGQM